MLTLGSRYDERPTDTEVHWIIRSQADDHSYPGFPCIFFRVSPTIRFGCDEISKPVWQNFYDLYRVFIGSYLGTGMFSKTISNDIFL